MKLFYGAAVMAMVLSPLAANAMKVTNLDRVPHTIVYEAAGTVHREYLAPNQTVNFYNMPNGRLSLATSPNPKQGATVEGTGIVSKYIGNGRDQGIPADQMDEYVIWKGGQLQLQRRTKRYGFR